MTDLPFPFARAEALIETGVVASMVGDDIAAERRARKALAGASSKESIAHQRKAEALLAGDVRACDHGPRCRIGDCAGLDPR